MADQVHLSQAHLSRARLSRTDHSPILVFGMPRSGTTWIGKLFDSHPDTLYRHEPDTCQPLDMPRHSTIEDAEVYGAAIREFVAGLPQRNALRIAGKRPFFPKSYATPIVRGASTLATEFSRLGSRVNIDIPILINCSGAGYAGRRVIWKSIQSLTRLETVLAAVDQARAIHVIRHPCGYLASLLRGVASESFTDNNLGGIDSEAYSIANQVVGTPLGDFYGFDEGCKSYLFSLSPEERIAWRWVLTNEKAWLAGCRNPRYRLVYYEDLCHEPEREVRRMFEFAGLEVTPQTLQFAASSSNRENGRYYSVYKDSHAAANRWRDELDSTIIERVMSIVARSRIGQRYVTMDATNTQAG